MTIYGILNEHTDFTNIDAKVFMEQFILWVKDSLHNKTEGLISIDGGNTPYIVSAFLSEVGIFIG